MQWAGASTQQAAGGCIHRWHGVTERYRCIDIVWGEQDRIPAAITCMYVGMHIDTYGGVGGRAFLFRPCRSRTAAGARAGGSGVCGGVGRQLVSGLVPAERPERPAWASRPSEATSPGQPSPAVQYLCMYINMCLCWYRYLAQRPSASVPDSYGSATAAAHQLKGSYVHMYICSL